jgi:hypothetical protein
LGWDIGGIDISHRYVTLRYRYNKIGEIYMFDRRRFLLVMLPFAAVMSSAFAADVAPDMTGQPRLAIGGYDTVAYFTDSKAVPGKLEYQTVWHDARWQFANQEHLDMFTKQPEKYAAQYDGHCAMGVSYEGGHKDTVDPEAWTIVNGKLYVNHTKFWTTEWRKNEAANISRADQNWQAVSKMPEPEK